VLDRGLYGYLVSRVALRHPEGGTWTLARALGEALPALEALEAEKGKDFGELVRERRRQRGLPVPVADRVLSRGAAVRFVLDKAISQVVAACRAGSDHATRRIADYLEARQSGLSVSAIAREWGLSREYTSRAIGRRAGELVTDRVLVLGRRKLIAQGTTASASAPRTHSA
jgi:hypothetical protein